MDDYLNIQNDIATKLKCLDNLTKDEFDDLEEDIRSLNDIIKLVESNRDKFNNISTDELTRRKKFLLDARGKITIHKRREKKENKISNGLEEHNYVLTEDPNESTDPKTQEQMYKRLEEEQDQYLGQIENSVQVIKQIGEDMNNELTNQNKVLDTLNSMADETKDKLRDVYKRVDKLVESDPNSIPASILAGLGVACVGLMTLIALL